eukprot:s696_g11.t1
MKAAGEQPKTRKVHIESHFDDCGTDFGSLAPFMTCEDNEVVADSELLSVHHAIECDLQPQLADGTDLGEVEEREAGGMAVTADGLTPQKPPPEVLRLAKYRSWVKACNGNPAVIISKASEFVTPIKDYIEFKYRTTWAKVGPHWYQLELAVRWDNKDDPSHFLPGIASPLITIFHPNKEIELTPFLTTTTDIIPVNTDINFGPDHGQPQVHTRMSAPKHRRTFTESGVGPEHLSDWSRFNVGRSLKALSIGSPATQLRELRKLHLRWWHGSKEAMRRILSAAGLGKEVLDRVAEVVDTCRECRKWTRPGPETVPTLRMTTKFNEHVEADLLFFREFVIFHMICCGTRWHAATVVRSKHEDELLEAVDRIWFSIHGPMQQLICDGESGLTNPNAQARLRRFGTVVKIRAPGQHARFIERRGAILRTTLHCLNGQLVHEGINATMDALLSEAVFAGNALIHVGGVTPYQCIYGRTPAMLPPLPDENHDAVDELSERSNQARDHIRTAALEAMIQATSLARTSRALRSRAIASTEIEYKSGDLVDYFRPTGKDTSGWHGPVEIIEYRPSEGTVIVKLNGQPRPCRLQDVRHTLFAHVSFQVFAVIPSIEAMDILKRFVQQLPARKYVTLGICSDKEGKHFVSQATKKHGHVLEALNHLVENAWCLDECQAVRLGNGCRSLPHMPYTSHSTLIYWDGNKATEPVVVIADSSQLSLADIMGEGYERMSFVQLIHHSENPSGLCDSLDATAETHGMEDNGQVTVQDLASDRLSTIPEGSHEDQDSDSQDPDPTFVNFLAQFKQPDLTTDADAYHDLWMLHQDTVTASDQQPVEDIPLTYVEPEDFNYKPIVDKYPNSPPDLNHDEPHLTELLVLPHLSSCFGEPGVLKEDEMFSIRMYHTMSKVEVIKRASDILSKDELIKHKDMVDSAILEELKIWDGYKCFKMVPRKGAENIIDSRFVAKWKVKDPSRPYESRVIRMRMALRGFKEWCAESLETYAATGSKVSQRLLLSEAACNANWSFLSLDINKAFLQGMTYADLSRVTGQDERVVHFTLPTGSAQILRMLPGYESYDERYHVLRCLKPGTGCKDAPRAFSLKLASVTRNPKIGLKPLSADPECEVKHVNGKLVLILGKHVDDLKIAGEESEVQLLLQALETTFGRSDRHDNNFTCVGIRHARDKSGTIVLDQNEYIAALKTLHHPDITGKPSDELCSEAVKKLFWSLLGAVAYTLLTQHWIAIYIIALQRQTHKPQCLPGIYQSTLFDYLVAEPVMIGATPGALLPAPITALAFPVCMFVTGPTQTVPILTAIVIANAILVGSGFLEKMMSKKQS